MNTLTDPEKLLTIKQLSQKLAVPTPTIRFWEEKLDGVIVPLRTKGGQRRYTSEHLTLIKRIRGLREEGKSLTHIKEMLAKKYISEDSYTRINDTELFVNRLTEIIRFEISSYLQNKEI